MLQKARCVLAPCSRTRQSVSAWVCCAYSGRERLRSGSQCSSELLRAFFCVGVSDLVGTCWRPEEGAQRQTSPSARITATVRGPRRHLVEACAVIVSSPYLCVRM